MDEDGSGYIDYRELSNYMKKMANMMGQPQPVEKQFKMMFHMLDENKDGKISRQEIDRYLSEIVLIIQDGFDKRFQEIQYVIALVEEDKLFELAEQTFKEFDTSGDGFIDQSELANFMVKLSEAMGVPPPSYHEISQVMAALDQNQDGKLSFEEVKPLLLQILQQLINASKAA